MAVVVRDAWHHLDIERNIYVGTLPLALGVGRWDDSGRWLGGVIEEMAPITDKQWAFLHERAKECNFVWGNLIWEHGSIPPKEKKCMFEHVSCP